MQPASVRRLGAAAALTALVLLPLTACGMPNSSSGGTIANATDLPTGPTGQELNQSPPLVGSSTTAARTVVDHFGDACAKIPTDPTSPASFAGMGNEAAGTALSHNPLTGRLYSAIENAGLVDTLNTAGNLTILAPDDDAFAKIPDAQLRAVTSDKQQLTKVLTYHVIPKRLSPEELSGRVATLEGANVAFQGSKPSITVGPSGTEASIVCGNIITQNATIYVIDTLLQPPG